MNRQTAISAMTLQVYRITSTGERVDLAQRTITLTTPADVEIDSTWPPCRCPRCPPPIPPDPLRW
ncbi:hypothetical protein [Kitasatospora sp. NBC_01266]|uniref:hypothetical protein n=1 Tax=Kitasatospora sp. NBC_01266 TaxID=2903572 RepID=UPI002E31E618|nr:hypothetical protein [Kitasatospora sp. NBC_01266]